jgi:hypothetical protein
LIDAILPANLHKKRDILHYKDVPKYLLIVATYFTTTAIVWAWQAVRFEYRLILQQILLSTTGEVLHGGADSDDC